MESSIGIDFAEVYNTSPLFQCAPRLVSAYPAWRLFITFFYTFCTWCVLQLASLPMSVAAMRRRNEELIARLSRAAEGRQTSPNSRRSPKQARQAAQSLKVKLLTHAQAQQGAHRAAERAAGRRRTLLKP